MGVILWPQIPNPTHVSSISPQISRFIGPTWGPPGSCWPQMGPMLAPWTLLSGTFSRWVIVASIGFSMRPTPASKVLLSLCNMITRHIGSRKYKAHIADILQLIPCLKLVWGYFAQYYDIPTAAGGSMSGSDYSSPVVIVPTRAHRLENSIGHLFYYDKVTHNQFQIQLLIRVW